MCRAKTRDGGTVMRLVVNTLVLYVVLASCSSPPSSSTDASSSLPPESESGMVSDPAGDAGGAQGFLDLQAAGVSEAHNSFTFTFTLAEPIPASFDVPKGGTACCGHSAWTQLRQRTPPGTRSAVPPPLRVNSLQLPFRPGGRWQAS